MALAMTSFDAGGTERLGMALGELLKPGEVVAFRGDLGAGKTTMIRGIARALGVTEPVTSPTYTVVNEYLSGRIPLFHFDLYRLRGPEDLFDIGWEDYLARGGVCVIEWSERIPGVLDKPYVVDVRRDMWDENARTFLMSGGFFDEYYGV